MTFVRHSYDVHTAFVRHGIYQVFYMQQGRDIPARPHRAVFLSAAEATVPVAAGPSYSGNACRNCSRQVPGAECRH